MWIDIGLRKPGRNTTFRTVQGLQVAVYAHLAENKMSIEKSFLFFFSILVLIQTADPDSSFLLGACTLHSSSVRNQVRGLECFCA